MEDVTEIRHVVRKATSNGAAVVVHPYIRWARLVVALLVGGVVGTMVVVPLKVGMYGSESTEGCLTEQSSTSRACGGTSTIPRTSPGGFEIGSDVDSETLNSREKENDDQKWNDKSNSYYDENKRGKQGYVSLLYGDQFGLAMRVLGQSLKESKTTRDMIALVTRQVSTEMQETLRLDGWVVRRVNEVENPGLWEQGNAAGRFPKRFWAVYTKLLVFSLDEYERLVYLDADTIVTRNIDELFRCDGFCAVLRHSERLNSGVMVLEPSGELYKDMMGQIHSLPSYTGGDQGFLNSYFSDFVDSPLFDPEKGKKLSELGVSPVKVGGMNGAKMRMARLPTKYNADLGLYVMNSNRWPIPEDSLGVIHYTLGTIKPWNWWSVWLLGKNAYRWQELRNRLPVSAGGWKYGMDRSQHIWSYVAIVAPFCIAFYYVRQFRRGLLLAANDAGAQGNGHGHHVSLAEMGGQKNYSNRSVSGGGAETVGRMEWAQIVVEDVRVMKNLQGPPWILVASALAGNVSIVLALSMIVFTIPSQMSYGYGWCLANAMLCIFVPLFYETYLNRAVFVLSRCANDKSSTETLSPRQHGRMTSHHVVIKWSIYALIMSCIMLVLWWTSILGIKTFSGKIIGTAVVAALSLVFTSIGFVLLGFMAQLNA